MVSMTSPPFAHTLTSFQVSQREQRLVSCPCAGTDLSSRVQVLPIPGVRVIAFLQAAIWYSRMLMAAVISSICFPEVGASNTS